jgi:hypothetical protein
MIRAACTSSAPAKNSLEINTRGSFALRTSLTKRFQ